MSYVKSLSCFKELEANQKFTSTIYKIPDNYVAMSFTVQAITEGELKLYVSNDNQSFRLIDTGIYPLLTQMITFKYNVSAQYLYYTFTPFTNANVKIVSKVHSQFLE